MLYLFIFIIIVLLVYSLRSIDVYMAFKKKGINIRFSESIKILLSLSKNQFIITFDLIKDNKLLNAKKIFFVFIFHFDIMLTLLSSIVVEVEKAVEHNAHPIVRTKTKKINIVEVIKSSLPTFNEEQHEIFV